MTTQKPRKSFRSQFDPLPSMNEENTQNTNSGIESEQVLVRVSTLMNQLQLEQMKDYCYWSGLSQQQLIEQAVTEYLSTKVVKPRPDAVKARPKTGRKPKA